MAFQMPRGIRGLNLCQIRNNIAWNYTGARNLAFHVARTEWVFCGDMDHVVSDKSLQQLLSLNFTDDRIVYIFNRERPDGYRGCDSVNNILMNRNSYLTLGGQDEDFAGHYGC